MFTLKLSKDASLLFIVSSLLFIGCTGSSSSTPQGYVAPESKDELPLVDHPEYTHWSKFPVGAFSIRKKTVTNSYGSVYVTTKISLAEKTDEKVVVEQQVTVVRPEVTNENPPQQMEFPAKFRLPKSVELEAFNLPSRKAKLVGEEIREEAGASYPCSLFEWEESNEAGPMNIKLWRSDEVPGRLVREETLIHSDGSTTLELISEVQVSGN